jgi:hypothetical protein
MQDILDLLMSNKLYMGIAVIVVVGLMIFLLKKVFKLFMILLFAILAFGVFIYVTEDDPVGAMKDKLNPAMDKLDDATKDLQREAIDKVIDEVDKQLKKAGTK